ncbi:M13 family metallopeptidase [Phenylobacterium conjunctum]|uniref:M13 family metallopeptidase n=1 Tax=Phenylobacterium conjunctum TaxID=1298959 RepID=A0ABW3T784_9CAUL
MKMSWFAGAALALVLAAPALTTPALAADAAAAAIEAPRQGSWGFDLAGRDLSVSPGHSFYDYANGTYVRDLVIPSDRTSFGSFDRLRELSTARMQAVVQTAGADKAAKGDEAKLGALYRSFMNEDRVNALGAKPLAPELARIKAARSASDIARTMGEHQHGFGGSAFGAFIYDDAKDPLKYTVYLGQGGLGLPDRDYYLKDRFATQKTAYQAYVAQILTLIGWPDADAQAKAIVELETRIAQVSWSKVEQRDDTKTYNPYDAARLDALAPGFDWKAFLAGAKLSGAKRVVVSENTAFPNIALIYAQTPLDILKAWTAFGLADQAAPYLSKDFEQAAFQFRDKTLAGQVEQKPRWKRGVSLVDSQIGEALGKLYVQAYFPAEAKAKMEGLVSDILTAMKGRIERVDWMGPQTRAKALEKLSKFSVMIAYPDTWRDYSALSLKDDDLYGNVQRAIAFEWDRNVRRMNGPVDRKEWGMTPPTVNAYYSPTKNGIVFPAAILQPPFFDPAGDMAINYGAIGGVIGHEITHGFDDQGRNFDGDGRLTDWWTPQDAAKFEAEAKAFGAQYSAIEILPGAHINGDLTMGENIADLGGLLLALDAYHVSLKGQPAPVIDGLTGDQRVFLGWAQVWRSKMKEDRQRQLLAIDPHSPNRARVEVPVRNIDAFYEAFGVKPGDKMYLAPDQRVRIW